MLKLVFDVKCGYEKKFMAIKDYELDVSFLAQKTFYNKLALLLHDDIITDIPSEEELFEKYSADPDLFVRETELGAIILSLVSTEVGAKYFPEVTDSETAPIIFPELFVVSNFRLIMTTATTNNDSQFNAQEEFLNLFKQESESDELPDTEDKSEKFDA